MIRTPFVTRAEAGLRRPKSISSAISPRHLTVHWAGPSPFGSGGFPDHARCANVWRGFQAFHMDGRGWADIAYTSGVCLHGVRFEGRGRGVRTAANGTNDGNSSSYAVCVIAGEGDRITDAAKMAIVDEGERLGVPVDRVHADWKGTGCPGADLKAWVHAGARRPGVTPPPPPNIDWAALRRLSAAVYHRDLLGLPSINAKSHPIAIALLQNALNFVAGAQLQADGIWGPKTEAVIRNFQTFFKLAVDGKFGPQTHFVLLVVLDKIRKGDA